MSGISLNLERRCRLESLGIGSAIQFQSSEPDDVVNCVNVVYRLMERLRLQKKYLEEVGLGDR